MKAAIIFTITLLSLLSCPLFGQDLFEEEGFDLYGYLVNYSQAGLGTRESGLGNTLLLRLKGDWSPGPNLDFHTELSYRGSSGAQNPYVIAEKYHAGSIDQGSYPFRDFTGEFSVDHLYGSVSVGGFDIGFGKLPIAWGTGYVFNPTARTHLPGVLDPVTEETPGTIAVMPSVSFGYDLALLFYLAFQEKTHKTSAAGADGEWQNLPYGIKLVAITGSWDLSVGFIKEVLYTGTDYRRSYYVGLDAAGAAGAVGLYGEAAILLPRNEYDSAFDFSRHGVTDLFDACVGFDYTVPGIDLLLRGEYYHQGSGEKSREGYDIAKVLAGEMAVLGEDYLFFNAERIFIDYLTVSLATLVNLTDGSGVVMPLASYDLYDNFQVSGGLFLFWGEQGSEFYGEHDLGEGTFDLTDPSLFVRCKLSF